MKKFLVLYKASAPDFMAPDGFIEVVESMPIPGM